MRQSHKMVKHSQTIRRQKLTNCLNVLDHFVGLVLKGLKLVIKVLYEVLLEDKLPEDWILSSLVPIYNRNSDPLDTNSYRGIKLLEHKFKLHNML